MMKREHGVSFLVFVDMRPGSRQTVIASEAKQSRTGVRRMGGAKRYPSSHALALMGIASLHPSYENTTSRSRDALRPRFAISFALLENRGRREDRVRAAPAVSCAIAQRKRAHEHTGSAEALRPSLRNGFTAYFVLSPVNGSFATVAPEKLASQELDASTAASGPHDFAVRFTPPSSVMASASTATCPNVRDDGRRPSGGTGWRQFSFDLPDGLSGIFLSRGSGQTFGLICPSGKLNAISALRICFLTCSNERRLSKYA